MYGALLVTPDHPEADFGVIFIHNEGYSTMCGHAVIALGRYFIDKGLVKNVKSPVTQVNIQCPAGLVKTFVEYENGKTGKVYFDSVPAFAFSTDIEVDVPEYGKLKLDMGYGGAFYSILPAQALGLDVSTSSIKDISEAADKVSTAVKSQVKIDHPDSKDLGFLYGTILTDGKDQYSDEPTTNVCVFADKEVDRCPCGSGVTARIAVQHAKGHIGLGDVRTFKAGATGSQFTGKALTETKCGKFDAVVVQVSGRAHYTGTAVFRLEEDDPLKHGFLLK